MKRKSNLLQVLAFLILAVVYTLRFLPTTDAKYHTQLSYNFKISKILEEFKTVPEADGTESYTIPKTGYYIIQALGGEGGASLTKSGSSTKVTYPTEKNKPANMCVYLTAQQVLSIRVGGGGCNGGDGNDPSSAKGFGGNRNNTGSTPYTRAGGNGADSGRGNTKYGGGGGGGATYIKLNNTDLLVAGGGGGVGTGGGGTTAGGDDNATYITGIGNSAAKSTGSGGGGGGYKGGTNGSNSQGGQGGSNYIKPGSGTECNSLPNDISIIEHPPRYEDKGYTKFGAKGIVKISFYSATEAFEGN